MKTFELSSKQYKDGKRHFKLILNEIYPDSCIVNGLGTQYNDNGITWLEEFCKNSLPSIEGMSLTCEFLDEERTELGGHGETGEVIDGIPIFSNATVIGTFSKGYIEDIEIDGVLRKFLVGEGYIDVFRYKPLVDKLDQEMLNGNTVYGSVEIFRTSNNNCIVYKYGTSEDIGRTPSEYIVSGYALLGIRPADIQAKLLELNSKNKNEREEKLMAMDEKDIAQIVSAVSEVCSKNTEFEATLTEKDTKISELNACIGEKESEVSELKTSVETLQKALDDLKKEQESYWEQRNLLEQEIAKYKVEQRLTELNSALSGFSTEEVTLVQTEIDAFKADPMVSEINSITDKIFVEIGKKSKEQAKVSEINSKNEVVTANDIFGDIYTPSVSSDDDVSIY